MANRLTTAQVAEIRALAGPLSTPEITRRLDVSPGTIGNILAGRTWREEQNRCQREIERHRNADKSYKDEGVALLDLARNAQRLFAKQEPREKRRLLNFVLSNCTWEDGEVIATFRQPFDMLAETATAAAHVGAGDKAKSAKTEIWLPFLDAYRTMCIAPSPDFLQSLEGISALRVAA
jgi:hypothetical protein